ncbi:MAG: cobalamin B12-binding domain-containing protein [Candidatus Portnoybacteria bacterium]|nr:cobalamin B12-binding domain-containing protein [Candidatus Portnoybacteria bacterium]
MSVKAKKPKTTRQEKVRFVTATTLFDGHDASINVFRRLLQRAGAEVIHLGHNRSAKEIVYAAIQEGAHAIAVSSYQGGHIEFFKYIKDLLDENGVGFIKIFGGGGGVIVPEEICELEDYGITKIYSPEDGQRLGLHGIIQDMIDKAATVKFPPLLSDWQEKIRQRQGSVVTRLISLAENDSRAFARIRQELPRAPKSPTVIGITGTGGSGKSSLEDEFIRRFMIQYPEKFLAIIAIDPTRKKTGGALLGDRIRMNFVNPEKVFMRSLATRESANELSLALEDSLNIIKAAGYDLIIVETPGIGQGDVSITKYVDLAIYVMTAEFGAPSQLEKIDMLDFADLIAINKFDHKNSLDALREVRKQYRRNHNIFGTPDDTLPIIGTVASNFHDPGLNVFFIKVMSALKEKGLIDWLLPRAMSYSPQESSKSAILPAPRQNYLSEIAGAIHAYHEKTGQAGLQLRKLEALQTVNQELELDLANQIAEAEKKIDPEIIDALAQWAEIRQQYSQEELEVKIRDKVSRIELYSESLAGLKIPKIVLPALDSLPEILKWLRKENLPGYFPYTAGVFPFRRDGEDPKRQFAGEGTPERTNARFHFLTEGDPAKRLSTAFDSLTLYGEDPSKEPDIFGKIGEAGVNICTLEDMKKLYKGFDLCAPNTSVSMTVNGPAPILLAFFFNTAIDQQLDKFKSEYGRDANPIERERIRQMVLAQARGTVQADILKEDQGQNSCIFSIPFALRLMGDVQQYFIDNNVRNFYSVSISGYHIAEAGANPLSQLAFTLANAFTYVEYYLSRGMKIDDFARNLSFFFSSGMDIEYNVIIRVARRIWSVAMKYKYGANESSQRLKCHMQTSGRSLHAQDMQFNDIRTTLQALMALTDNCNSLHTNSYDEAVTTPTEESVRRAMAIQLIIGKEYGIFKNQNPLQGSFIIEKLTDMVEETVLNEFDSLSQRGGVLGAMESYYQRGKIQDESLNYELKKHAGEYPIIGVNTYVNPNVMAENYSRTPTQLTRSTYEEKQAQLENLNEFKEQHKEKVQAALDVLKQTVLRGGNIFAELMETVKVASLGQITQLLYEVGGKYRRNM